jgi:autotransporter-associated beta strand protein
VVCDSSAPNPYYGSIGGTTITLNSGAQVQANPFGGASVNYDTISLYGTGGQLTAQNGSTILNSYGGRAVVAGANTTSNLAGTVTVTNGGIGVSLGQGGTLNVGSTAVIDASSSSGSTNSSSAIQVTGTGTVIQIDGTVRNSSSFGGSTITMISRDFFANTVTGTGTVNISATGQVLSTGASSPAIILASGSTVNIAGLVRAYTASNAIDDRGTAGGTTTVNILAGGTVQSSGLPAIIGSAGAMNLTIAGTIRSGAASAVQLGSGNDVVTLVTGSSVDGAIDGGGGTNTLNLTGNGTGQLGTTTNFANVAINAGSWTLAAPVSASNGVTIAAGATGIGSASQWGSAISNAGTLVFNQSADETYTGTLSGTGQLVKSGAGSLTLGTQSGFTGTTLISAGQLVINGFMPSPVTVASGATLAGNGRVGGLTVQSGGLVSPGTASGSGVGTLSVAGNFVQAAGSTYAAQVVGSNADQITVTGTATLAAGSKLVITTQNAVRGTRYTLLTANGGVNGQYTVVQSDIAYQLSYLGNSVVLTFGRSKEGMLALAQGANQLGAANALLGLPASATLYSTLGVASDDNTLRAAYPQLTGDLHGAVRAAILHTADMVTETALARSGMRQAGLHLWGQLLGSTGNSTGLGGAAPCRAKAMAV